MKVPEKHREIAHAWVDGAEIECNARGEGWEQKNHPEWVYMFEYRVKATPDSMDWSQVAEKYVAHARDKSGEVFLYERLPSKLASSWGSGDGCVSAAAFQSLTIGTTEWQDSLVLRPAKETK